MNSPKEIAEEILMRWNSFEGVGTPVQRAQGRMLRIMAMTVARAYLDLLEKHKTTS